MRRREKVAALQEILLKWYKVHGRSFPWREIGLGSYQLIMTEILLQRTKSEIVKKNYHAFFAKYNGWQDLKKRSLERDLTPFGLQSLKAKRIQELHRQLNKIHFNLPEKSEELRLLTSLGQYTTNAVLLLVHNTPAPLLDNNMSRVLERIFRKRKLKDIRYDKYLQRLSADVVYSPNSKQINWALLDVGALICKPKPLCQVCPLTPVCNHYKKVIIKLRS